MQTMTSAASALAASTAQTAFITLSEEGRSAERWLPVNTTGTGRSSMNESAAAEYCIVSVPCITTTPSAPASTSSWTARASSIQTSGVMFSERMFATTRPR